jgi:hypothetical protein
MELNNRIQAFSILGDFLRQFIDDKKNTNLSELNNNYYEEFKLEIRKAEVKNRWFIEENMLFSIKSWANLLQEGLLKAWIKDYKFSNNVKSIGVIQAGNIPLVGFHDFLSVLISGHSFVGKASSKDDNLPRFLSEILISIEQKFKDKITWVERLSDYDAVIATGSDNTARYFEYYFGKKPNIIRKNRNSWAIITGNETKEELFKLGEDIFTYYGLGCRNISKIFVPDGYDFIKFFEAIEPFKWVYNNNKYANNFDYNQSVYLMNQIKFLENGFFIIKEDVNFHSPLSVAFYENYSTIEFVQERIKAHENEIQLISSAKGEISNTIPFGQAQIPQLWDYADNIDTLRFLSEL